MSTEVTVAIPVRNAGHGFARVLASLGEQTVPHELLVCDSGSNDGSPELVRAAGGQVLEISAREFGHGSTRNLLMQRASGARVAFLTQDAEPADKLWLERLLSGFDLSGDVAIVCGPYLPRPDAPLAVRLELEEWFGSMAPDGIARVDRLSPDERRELPVRDLVGRRGFFTDVNACLSRSAWERVPYRAVTYAEDRLLAIDMLRAGFAKAYVPSARVLHSHDYTSLQELRRCFDEWRALREIYGWGESAAPSELLRGLRGRLRAALSSLPAGQGPLPTAMALLAITRHHLVRTVGGLLGSHAGVVPSRARAALSLEHRAGFAPLDLEHTDNAKN